MFRHYCITAIRHLARNKLTAAINIGGLSIALACTMLIMLYLRNELSYDSFHAQKRLIYQLTCKRIEQDGKQENFAIAAQVQGPAFQQAIPEIRAFVRLFKTDMVVRSRNDIFKESVSWADPAFFQVFSFPLLAGDPANTLRGSHDMVLSETAARKYFGTTNAVGRQLQMEINGRFELFVVSGVAADCPPNSSIQFNILLNFRYYQRVNPDNGWMWVSFPTYLLLSPDAHLPSIAHKMQQVYEADARDEIELNGLAGYHNHFEWSLLPMTDMHFRKEYAGTPDVSDPIYPVILAGIALFVLVIASINFINLTIAQSLKRSREIGIRKAVGGVRRQLMWQFLGEAVSMCLVAWFLALGLAACALPAFGTMTSKALVFFQLVDGPFFASSLAMVILTGCAAGLYPALVLSGFRPVVVLRGDTPHMGRNRLARALVVIQFVLAAILSTSIFFMYAQFRLITTADTGYDDRHLLTFSVPNGLTNRPLMDYYKTQFSRLPGVITAGYQNIGHFGGRTRVQGRECTATYVRVDGNYPAAIGGAVLRGRSFDPAYAADSSVSALVNETLASQLGMTDPIGRQIDYLNIPGWGARKLTIVGELRDFHYGSMKEPIQPMVFIQDNALPLGKMLVRLQPDRIPGTLRLLDKAFHRLNPDRPFTYSFADETNRMAYEPERRWGQIIGWGAVMTILIAGTGLFGLSCLAMQRRRKEIGIRKAMGGSVIHLTAMIAREFTNLVLLAFAIAIPISYIVLHRWLQAYPYRVELSWWRFAAAGTAIWLLALLTVGFHALRAARANPLLALRSE